MHEVRGVSRMHCGSVDRVQAFEVSQNARSEYNEHILVTSAFALAFAVNCALLARALVEETSQRA